MICIESLRKYFTDESDITYRDLTFEDGKSYVLLGASGCGKSTLLHMISGVLSPPSGRILINGKDMAAAPQREKDAFRIAKIGYIFQDFKLIDEMTVQDNIDVLKLEKVDVSRTDELLERMGILKLKKRQVSRLSGGEKQRVSIARALLRNAPVLVLDDSTSALDVNTEKRLLKDIKENFPDRTLLISAHRLSSVVDCDEILYMKDGIILERGTFDELMALDGHFASVYKIQEAQDHSIDFDALAEREA